MLENAPSVCSLISKADLFNDRRVTSAHARRIPGRNEGSYKLELGWISQDRGKIFLFIDKSQPVSGSRRP